VVNCLLTIASRNSLLRIVELPKVKEIRICLRRSIDYLFVSRETQQSLCKGMVMDNLYIDHEDSRQALLMSPSSTKSNYRRNEALLRQR
jgi:hypothetical protein